MKRFLAALAASLMLFAACGDGDDAVDALATPLPEGTDDAAATDEPETTSDASSDDEGDAGEPKATAKATSKDDAGDDAPDEPDPGTINEPKVGTYTFNAKGEASDPTNPTAQPQKYEGTATTEISRSGSVTTRTDSADNQPGQVTLRTKREATQVLLLSYKAETPAGDYSCTLDPPIVITKFPVKAGQHLEGDFKGDGNACDGTISIDVVKQEAAKDASGKSWDAWLIVLKQTLKAGQLTTKSEQTRWVSPELGVEIKTSGKTSGTFGASKFSGSGTTVLKDRP